MRLKELEGYYRGKRVLVTGHTGFKGSWLSLLLTMLGAEVYGYSLPEPTEPGLFSILRLDGSMHSEIGDIRDYERLRGYIEETRPEVILHLAAQPIVRTSYRLPRETYETNVMGTVNLLEAVRECGGVRSLVNVTTDKVYDNPELPNHAFTEDEKLDGYDPYSNSKSCSELVSHSYRKAFFSSKDSTAISTVRAGNVIGGGDFAVDRIIPDCVRAVLKAEPVEIRNPYSVRPYQHVLEPLRAYIELAALQDGYRPLSGDIVRETGEEYIGSYNVGPEEEDAVSTGELAGLFVSCWGEGASWISTADKDAPHEAEYLRLNSERIRRALGWSPRWHIRQAVEKSVDWYRALRDGRDMREFTERQIIEFYS